MSFERSSVPRDKKISELTVKEFEEVIHYATVHANNRLFHGIAPFLDTFAENLDTVINEVKYLKSSLNNKADNKLETQLSFRDQQIQEMARIITRSVDYES